jgi:hypothetical protein
VIPKSAIYRDYIIEIFNEVLERKRPQYTENIFILPGQSVPTMTKRLILPLSDDGATVNMTLNAYDYEYPDGKAHQFAEAVITFQELVREYLDP